MSIATSGISPKIIATGDFFAASAILRISVFASERGRRDRRTSQDIIDRHIDDTRHRISSFTRDVMSGVRRVIRAKRVAVAGGGEGGGGGEEEEDITLDVLQTVVRGYTDKFVMRMITVTDVAGLRAP